MTSHWKQTRHSLRTQHSGRMRMGRARAGWKPQLPQSAETSSSRRLKQLRLNRLAAQQSPPAALARQILPLTQQAPRRRQQDAQRAQRQIP